MLKIKNKKGELVAELRDEDDRPIFVKKKRKKKKKETDIDGHTNQSETKLKTD